ncbi:sensor histidine kinase [Pseudidiomarina woesei]|uniref:histidine kinase n=1 Tax=Pseudidiomarina woesei TaxID=1381080 RepID=A0A0K6HDD0_9GAMM|nr:ATP-binding protein [Pseudidiomarina woesei]CUA88786.1 His Kinase A (phospho-acceptor) domain/Histidine kinase-, DNA gyrase B-, and HSP90-like ATPase [Pseudidiomarina woesei]
MTKRYISWLPNWSGLQRTLAFYVMLPLLVLSGIAIGVGLERAAEFQDKRLRDDLELIGRAIHVPVSDALIQGDIAAVRASLGSVFEIGRVYGASVYDTNGKVVASAGITERDLSESLLAEQVILTGESQDDYRQVAGRDVFSQFVPIQGTGGQIIGFMQLNRRAQDFDNAFGQLARIAWGTWLVLALATIAILIFGHYRGVHRYVEEKLEWQRRQQEKMVAIGQVSSGVAHELGAPLTVIDARAKKLQKRHLDDDSQRQLQAIRGQVQRLTKMVNQLLAFSRTPVANKTSVALKQIISQAQQAISFEQGAEGPQLKVELPSAEVMLEADIPRLELALVNIFRNALQAASQQVTVKTTVTPETVTVYVNDDGAGLPEELSETQLIEPFTTTKGIGQGTGLGLALVSYIVHDHQGKLQLKNHAKGGCEVSITLPRRQKIHQQISKQGQGS